MTDGKRADASWTFADQREAERKFTEVCGPLCTEAWLIEWSDHPSIPGKIQVHLRHHWTTSNGTDEIPVWLCDVNTSDQDTLKQTNDDLSEPDIDWDALFETTPNDSEISLFIDPDQFTSDNTYGHFEVGFRKFSFGRKPRLPDYESCFRGLTFSCQWDSNSPNDETYGWNAQYGKAGIVGLKRAQRMAEMLEKIHKIEKSLPSPPRSFGEYVAAMAKRLGLKSGFAGCRKECESVATQSSGTYGYVPLKDLELQNFVNQLIADRRQPFQYKQSPDAFPVSPDSGEANRRMSNRDEIRRLALAVSNGLNEYIEVHNKIFQESATFKSVVKNLFGRGASMPQLLDDSERLVPPWAAIYEDLEAFRRMSYLSLVPDQRSYFDLLSRYAMAIKETVHALVERQRLLNDGGRLTLESFQEKEQLYRSAVAQYVLIGQELNAAAPIIFD